MKNKSKYYRIPVCIFVFVVGSITAMLFASVLNDVLTTGSISTDLTDFSTTISGVFGGEKPRKLYLLLEALVVLLCVVYFVCAERTYQTDTYKVTDNISVPVPSGQGQHGTAWFMSDKIKRRAFDYISISKSDPLISRLVSIGENRYRAIENGEAFNPPKADQTLTDSAGIFLAREMSRGTERASDKLSITLETVDSDIWEDIFGIDEELKQYVEQSRACARKQRNTVAVRRVFGASPVHLRHKGHGSSRKRNYAGAEIENRSPCESAGPRRLYSGYLCL